MIRENAPRLACLLLLGLALEPVAAQLRPGEYEQYGDRLKGQFGDPSEGYFGNPADGRFGSRFPAEPWMPLLLPDSSAVDSSPYVVLPYPADPRRDRIDERQNRDPAGEAQ